MNSKNNRLIGLMFFVFAIVCSFTIIDLSAEEAVEIEKKSSEAIRSFIKNYQGGRFKYISNGNFFHLPKEAQFGIWVTAKTKETVESGRTLTLTFIKDYFSELQTNKNTSKWHQTLCVEDSNWYSGKMSLKNIGVRIAFWDENVNRPAAPYLAEIDFYENKLRYYEADPKTQALKLVLEESYEDALKQQHPAK